MKKTVIALAVAAASVAGVAHADGTTLYGSVRLSVENTTNFDDNNYSDVANNSSRFGIKGTEDLGNGLSAFYRYEFGVKADKGSIATGNTQRLAYAGIKSDTWGAISLGAQWSPYYNVVGYNDIFNGNFSYDRTYLGPFRLTDVLAYTSPNWSGFQFQVALVSDGEEDEVNGTGGSSDDLDAYNVGLSYTNGGFFAGLSYLGSNGLEPDESGLVGGVVGFSNDLFRIGLVAEAGSDYTVDYGFVETGDDPYNVSLAGEYYFGDTDLVRAAVEYIDYDTSSSSGVDVPEDAVHLAVGYQHNFSLRTRVWAEYSYFDVDELDDELQTLSIGLRTDF